MPRYAAAQPDAGQGSDFQAVHAATLHLREVIIFLLAAGIIVPLFRRVKISPILGFLIVGMVIGPYGLASFVDVAPWLRHAVIDDVEFVNALAEMGVIFLLFMIGLELSLERLWAMRRLVFGLGGAQVLVTAAVITAIAAMFDNTLPMAVILGAGFALSSTAIVMQLLSEQRRLGTEVGRTSFSILLFQDLAVLPILFMVSAFAARGEDSPVIAFAIAMGQAAAAVVVVLVLGRLLLRPLFRFVGAADSRELFLALVLLVIIGTAMAMESAGLSAALGAFVAGLLMAETEYRHEVELDIEPFKGLLLGVFFVSVGMEIDLTEVLARPVLLGVSVIGLFVIKAPIIYGLGRAFGQSRPVAAESAVLLSQGGEFALLVVSMAFALGLMDGPTAQFMLIVTSLTMMATPMQAHFGRRLGGALEARGAERQRPAAASPPSDLKGHVVIAGYGRVGQMLAAILEEQEMAHYAIDNDAHLLARSRRGRDHVFFGDASRPDMLRRLGADRATALVVTINSPQAAERIVAAARREWPGLSIHARAHDNEHARRLRDLGADRVVPETVEASLQLADAVLISSGLPGATAHRIIEAHRASLEESGELDEEAAEEVREKL
ncbi:potassium transporter [Minwuia thermotolerans]|uniref:Potassium transporter n=1 Tax=Minwuia thermotolerans TaxID=2056226 RepID=A0A2M9FWX8_9PROT|nr:potassium transporter [Minwuia thermotolerans]